MLSRLISFYHINRREILRWGVSGAVVLAAHISIAAAVIVGWNDSDDSFDPVGAMVIELAPTPVAPENTPTEIPPGPEQVQAEATPERLAEPTEKVVDKVVEPDKVKQEQQDIPPQENPEVALQKKAPEPTPEKPAPSEAQLAAPVTTAPQMPKVDVAAMAAAPMQTQFNLVDSNAIPTWKKQVARKLERNKRYPANAHDDKGIAQLEFSVDRQGHLKSSRIIKSSGSTALDRETLDLVRRAEPFAAPPPAMTGEEVFLTVPIKFNVR
ncbi:MAG: TonB family protein [Afipia sp.]